MKAVVFLHLFFAVSVSMLLRYFFPTKDYATLFFCAYPFMAMNYYILRSSRKCGTVACSKSCDCKTDSASGSKGY
jgi:hypothetical protein